MNPTIPPSKDKGTAEEGPLPGLDPAARPLPPDARILIVRFTSLGDVVKATALPRLIKARYPAARVTLLTAEVHLPLVEANPHLDRAIGFRRAEGLPGLWRLARRLRREGVDLIADVHKSLRSRLLSAWIGAPRVAYSKRTLQRLLLVRFGINTYRPPRRKEEDFTAALAPYGIRDDGRGTEISLAPLERDDAFPDRFAEPLARIASWRSRGLPVLGVAPVAAWELKRWSPAAFGELTAGFVRATGGGVLVFGGAADEEAADLAAALGDRAISLVGRTTLLESARFAAQADLVIANDTGMAHLAEAVGTDVVVLFGPTSRELGYFPSRPGSRVLERDLPCRPCTRMGEGRCTHPLPKACLALISPATALEAVLARLGAVGQASAVSARAEGPC